MATDGTMLDAGRLMELAQRHRDGYRSAEPFPHAVLDDFLPSDVAERILAAFPAPGEIAWHRFDRPTEKKLATTQIEEIPPAVRLLLHEFNSPPALRFLETLTGIPRLIPDPYLRGGGLHQIERGGWLKVHADFNRHEDWGLDRRLNLLLYFNKDWQEDYAGHLELWDPQMTRCVKKVAPLFNRCVVFTTTESSFHGHPDPLLCPPGQTRKSMALYYYTVGRPESEGVGTFPTTFRERPDERIPGVAWRVAQELLPPALWRGIRRLRHRDR